MNFDVMPELHWRFVHYPTAAPAAPAAPAAAALLLLLEPPGIYGMNFDVMPELHWRFGYAYCYLLFVGVVALAVLLMWYNGLIKVCLCCSFSWEEGGAFVGIRESGCAAAGV
jgi:hypothetical protein